MEDSVKKELQSAAFERLIHHLRERKDVQNLDLMNLAGFCRNCLSKWYLAAANERGVKIDYAQAREVIYGMPYDAWIADNQTQASEEQKRIFSETKPFHAKISGHN